MPSSTEFNFLYLRLQTTWLYELTFAIELMVSGKVFSVFSLVLLLIKKILHNTK